MLLSTKEAENKTPNGKMAVVYVCNCKTQPTRRELDACTWSMSRRMMEGEAHRDRLVIHLVHEVSRIPEDLCSTRLQEGPNESIRPGQSGVGSQDASRDRTTSTMCANTHRYGHMERRQEDGLRR